MTEPAFAATAPVFSADGAHEPELGRDLVRLDVAEDVLGLRTLSACFLATAPRRRSSNDVVEYLDGGTLDFGKRLQVTLGPPGNERIVFAGSVSALEVRFTEGDVPVVTVLAEDDLMRLRLRQHSETYTSCTDADVAGRVVRRHGLKADISLDGPTYESVQQLNQSDLAFLRERARRLQAELWAGDGVVHLATRDRRPGTQVTLTRGSDLIDVAVRADLAHQCTAVRVSGYDARARAAIDAEAPSSTVDTEITGGRTGPQTLRRAFGDLPGRRIRDVPLAEPVARALARAEMLRRSRAFVQVRGTTAGTPQLVVGSRVRLARCGRPFDGDGYYVTGFHHSYDLTSGMRTRFTAERPTVNAA
ncbi:phage late control D family protein [Nonomuraea sp. PA05]|uniref:phage late control D family protein n=1 Tax=Nonomuraea sp. PA05 TaxID=2604466 RepID=UPI0011D455CE|nr:contractile injection system protein, VgrG/Pvc8 family [Nonomuraea sp. PA05]TYB64798.1 phage late control D family protein [Nonomuraea sp. PA05]